MAIAWFVCPYKRRLGALRPTRYCAMSDFSPRIRAEGGAWSGTEILGDRAIVKVRASAALLEEISQVKGFTRIPMSRLDDSLAALGDGARESLRAKALEGGYQDAELRQVLPDMKRATFRDLLRFMARRRLKPRYDEATDTIVLDGPEQPVKPIDRVDADVLDVSEDRK